MYSSTVNSQMYLNGFVIDAVALSADKSSAACAHRDRADKTTPCTVISTKAHECVRSGEIYR